MFPHWIYNVTSLPVEVTYIFHISTWNFFCLLKNSNRRMDILVWIFLASTSNLSCHLYTSGGDLYIPTSYSNKMRHILLWIFHVSTCNLLCHLHTYEGDQYFPHFHIEYLLHVEKLSTGPWIFQYRLSTFPHLNYNVNSLPVSW